MRCCQLMLAWEPLCLSTQSVIFLRLKTDSCERTCSLCVDSLAAVACLRFWLACSLFFVSSFRLFRCAFEEESVQVFLMAEGQRIVVRCWKCLVFLRVVVPF